MFAHFNGFHIVMLIFDHRITLYVHKVQGIQCGQALVLDRLQSKHQLQTLLSQPVQQHLPAIVQSKITL